MRLSLGSQRPQAQVIAVDDFSSGRDVAQCALSLPSRHGPLVTPLNLHLVRPQSTRGRRIAGLFFARLPRIATGALT